MLTPNLFVRHQMYFRANNAMRKYAVCGGGRELSLKNPKYRYTYTIPLHAFHINICMHLLMHTAAN